ncbi:MAG TPA: glycosyltransferase family 2 protein [Solirubrobacterales bacterium]
MNEVEQGRGAAAAEVSVVILTGGGRLILDRTLDSVLADPGTAEVVIVLDAQYAVGDTAAARVAAIKARSQGDQRLRVVPLPADDGKGLWRVQRGRDAGVEAARSEVVLMLDDDVVLHPGVVAGHACGHAEEANLVLIGYMPVATHYRWPRTDATVRVYSDSYEHQCNEYERNPESMLKGLWGGNVSVRRADWLRAIQRPRIAAWGHDDQEVGLLFLREGLQARFDRSLRGDHYYERSLSRLVERAEKSPPAQVQLSAANPDLLEAPVRRHVPWTLVRALRSPLVWGVVRGALEIGIALTGALRLGAAGKAGAGVLWTLARARAEDAGRGSPAVPPAS